MADEYFYTPSKKDTLESPPHYYGDTVRALFIAGGIVLLVTAGVYRNTFDMPIFLPFIGVIGLFFFAGLTMYRQKLIVLVDVFISALSAIIFEFLVLYGSHSRDTLLFWIYQALAINFLIALYYSVKTLRNNLLLKKNNSTEL